jgi:hypothetical protein
MSFLLSIIGFMGINMDAFISPIDELLLVLASGSDRSNRYGAPRH